MEEQIYVTRFYHTPAGGEPVREFLRSLPRDARLKCGRYVQQLEWQGLALRASHLKKLTREIWELRPEYDGSNIASISVYTETLPCSSTRS